MSLLVNRYAPVMMVLGFSMLGCGGTKPVRNKAVAPTVENNEPTDDESSRGPKPPDCSDGTCFSCGQGLCLPGFFCDESQTQPNCQWTAKCGRATSCSCLSELLGTGCKCTERSGGVYVKCST